MSKGLNLRTIKYILFSEPTRWAELLLGMVKIMLGLSLLWYLWDPPLTSIALKVGQAAIIGGLIMALGIAQLIAVLVEWKLPRFIVSCLATGMWIFFMGSQWLAVGSLRPILVYFPLLFFNVIVAIRIARGGISVVKDPDDAI